MKKWIIAATCFLGVGLLAFVSVMTAYRWDFAKLNTGKYVTDIYEINEDFNDLSITVDTSDVAFVSSADGKCKVECYHLEKITPVVAVRENTLVVETKDERAWYEYIGIDFSEPKMVVYLPKTEYTALTLTGSTGGVVLPKEISFESVDISLSTGVAECYAFVSGLAKIQTSTGNIRVENARVGALALSVTTGRIVVAGVTCEGDITVGVSTGKTRMTDTTCKNFSSRGNTGDIDLIKVVASGNFSIERSTGDVSFARCDAENIFIKTSTGEVEGSLLSPKVFVVQTSTGEKEVPRTTTGGRCEITTTTGDIEIELAR